MVNSIPTNGTGFPFTTARKLIVGYLLASAYPYFLLDGSKFLIPRNLNMM